MPIHTEVNQPFNEWISLDIVRCLLGTLPVTVWFCIWYIWHTVNYRSSSVAIVPRMPWQSFVVPLHYQWEILVLRLFAYLLSVGSESFENSQTKWWLLDICKTHLFNLIRPVIFHAGNKLQSILWSDALGVSGQSLCPSTLGLKKVASWNAEWCMNITVYFSQYLLFHTECSHSNMGSWLIGGMFLLAKKKGVWSERLLKEGKNRQQGRGESGEKWGMFNFDQKGCRSMVINCLWWVQQ